MFGKRRGSRGPDTADAYLAKRRKDAKAKAGWGGWSKSDMLAVLPSLPRAPRGVERTGGYYGRFTGPSAELKFFDTAVSFNVDLTGEVPSTGQLCLIPQGTTESTRIGRKATIKSMQFNGACTFVPGANTFGADTIFMYVVLDSQCNGAAATAADVLTGANFSSALPNIANSQRFKILKRFVIPMRSQAGVQTAFASLHEPIAWYRKCNIPIEWSSTTGALTEIRSNNIFLLAGTGQLTDDLMGIIGTFRLRYSDS